MASEGVYWTPAHKEADSRPNGWELLRGRLKNVMKAEGPHLFVFNTCRQFFRTVPVLPRDEIDMDDVDSRAEGRVDEARDSPLGRKKKTGSAAAPCVAFPAEQRDLEA